MAAEMLLGFEKTLGVRKGSSIFPPFTSKKTVIPRMAVMGPQVIPGAGDSRLPTLAGR